MRMTATDRRFASSIRTAELVAEGSPLVGALPGVDGVGATLTGLPLEGEDSILRISTVGRALDDSIAGSWRIVLPGYFNVFQISLLRGRLFTDRDDRNSPAVVVINQALARRFWPAGDPLNDRILLGQGAGPDFEDVPRQIIGVVGDIRQAGLDRDPLPAAHVPLAQLPDAGMAFFDRLGIPVTWVIRTSTQPYPPADAVQNELRRVSGAPVTQIRSMEDVSEASTARRQFEMWLDGVVFAMVPSVLSAVALVAAWLPARRATRVDVVRSLHSE